MTATCTLLKLRGWHCSNGAIGCALLSSIACFLHHNDLLYITEYCSVPPCKRRSLTVWWQPCVLTATQQLTCVHCDISFTDIADMERNRTRALQAVYVTNTAVFDFC